MLPAVPSARLALVALAAAAFAGGGVASACGGAEAPARAAAFRAEVRHVRVYGASLAYYERGSGPPLLMNMGSASTMAEWDPALLRALAARHRLVIYDYRGIGRSSVVGLRGLTIARLADDGAALLRALHIRRASVLGWSLGGFVAQQMAIRHPAVVERLILAGTNPGGPEAVLGPEWAQRIDSEQGESDETALRVLFPPGVRGRAAGHRFLRRVQAAAGTGEIPDDFTVPRAGFDAQLAAEERWMATDANLRGLARVQAPTLVAGARLDVLTPPANDAVIARAIPGARRSLFRDGGHAFLFQFHGPFGRLANRFLAG
jgi:pimeloyl-ACP methyl ester carboxylesterase